MKLNLGCGDKRKPGFLGVDQYRAGGVDVLADVTRLPFADSSVDAFHLDNVIEHIPDMVGLVRELVRTGRPGAAIEVITPHFTAWASWRDPTHVHHLSYFSMDHFAHKWVADFAGARVRVASRRLSFGGGLMGLTGRLLFWLSPRQYEKKYCFIFRASTLCFRLEVVKQQ
ncbi:MAG TPA: methyltransferase domain-containing protein [Terriglobales bacterium]|nr:methyltransferase domain-containing protein [Terriglobales bacterium]